MSNRIDQPLTLEALPAHAFTISHSSQELFASCARKLEFRKFYQHARNMDDSLPAEVGHALHGAWQNWLQFKDEDAALWELIKGYPMEIYSEMVKYEPRTIEAVYATFQELIRSVVMAKYEIVTIKCLDGVERPAVEVPFAIEIGGFSLNGKFKENGEAEIPVFYVGYVDAFLFDLMKSMYTTHDLKSHRNNLEDLDPLYRYSDQQVPYGLVLEHILGKRPEYYQVSYISCYVDLENPKVKPYNYIKTLDEVQDWYTKLVNDLTQISQYYIAQWFPRRGGYACLSFRSACSWLDDCQFREPEILQQRFLFHGPAVPAKPFVPWVRFKLDMAA